MQVGVLPERDDQDDVGTLVVGGNRPVVRGEREVGRVDARAVDDLVRDAVRAPRTLARLDLEFALERAEERVEKVEEQAVAALHDAAQVVLDQRAENDRAQAVLVLGRVDLPYGFFCLVNRGDKWQGDLSEFEALELREQAVPHRLGCHAGLVRYEKYRSAIHRLGGSHGAISARSVSSPSLM
jgi:hypothetical protein